MLAAAFATDPPLAFITEGPRQVERLRRYFADVLPKSYLPHGETWVSDDPAGAAVWLAPGHGASTRGVRTTLLRTFGRRPVRALASLHAIERGDPKGDYWYLDYIAVDPSAQGRGTGSALLAPRLERCDAEGVPAYLNAGSERSRELYRRHGFEATAEFRLPFGGPPLWRMWRTPR